MPTSRARGPSTRALLADLARTYPDEHDQGNFGIAVAPLRADLLGPSRPVLLVLAGAVALVLLLTCANVAGLLLARVGRPAPGAGGARGARAPTASAWCASC